MTDRGLYDRVKPQRGRPKRGAAFLIVGLVIAVLFILAMLFVILFLSPVLTANHYSLY